MSDVNAALRTAAIDLTVAPGAEVALSRVGELTDAELAQLGLAGGPYILLEFPRSSAIGGAVNAFRAFTRRGHRALLAHPERSLVFQRNPEFLRGLVEEGALCCLNASSLTDQARREVRAFAWRLLSERLIHAIASDFHDVTRRPPALRQVLEQSGLDAAQIEHYTVAGPTAIVNGEVPPAPPSVTRPARFRWAHRGRA